MFFMSFRSYSLFSFLTTAGMVFHAVQKQEGSFFNTVVYLTSQKINLLVFFNFFVILLVNMAGILIWIFFDQIRLIESKVRERRLIIKFVVHYGQVVKEDLSFSATCTDPAIDL